MNLLWDISVESSNISEINFFLLLIVIIFFTMQLLTSSVKNGDPLTLERQ